MVINKSDSCLVGISSPLSMLTIVLGGNEWLRHLENGCRTVVYLWDINVDFINWRLAPETGESACSTWDLLTCLIVNRTNYGNWIPTKPPSVTSLHSANPIEQRTTAVLLKSHLLLRQSHLFICAVPQTPNCIWCPWTKIICPEGDLYCCGFLLKSRFQQTGGKSKGQETRPRPVGCPPPRCQSPETEGDCLQMASSFGTAGERPCGRHDRSSSAKAMRSSPWDQKLEKKLAKFWQKGLARLFMCFVSICLPGKWSFYHFLLTLILCRTCISYGYADISKLRANELQLCTEQSYGNK